MLDDLCGCDSLVGVPFEHGLDEVEGIVAGVAYDFVQGDSGVLG